LEKNTIDLVATQNIYALATQAALRIFELSRSFPHGGPHSVYSQIIEHSGAVCSHLAEAWQNRGKFEIFIENLNEAAVRVTETQNQVERAVEGALLDVNMGEQLKASYETINDRITNILQEINAH
jgi:four helix bundle protein